MCPGSTPIASAHCPAVHLHGELPCTAKMLPEQHGCRSGLPNASRRRHRRRAPKQQRSRSRSPGRLSASS
eukprot:3143701-Prymnesium_polylepis.1